MTCKCVKYAKFLPNLLKISENIKVLSRFEENELKSDEFMVVMNLKSLVIVVISIKTPDGTCDLEARSNDENLRSSFLLLLAYHLSD